jgi:hypothetical protein
LPNDESIPLVRWNHQIGLLVGRAVATESHARDVSLVLGGFAAVALFDGFGTRYMKRHSLRFSQPVVDRPLGCRPGTDAEPSDSTIWLHLRNAPDRDIRSRSASSGQVVATVFAGLSRASLFARQVNSRIGPRQ